MKERCGSVISSITESIVGDRLRCLPGRASRSAVAYRLWGGIRRTVYSAAFRHCDWEACVAEQFDINKCHVSRAFGGSASSAPIAICTSTSRFTGYGVCSIFPDFPAWHEFCNLTQMSDSHLRSPRLSTDLKPLNSCCVQGYGVEDAVKQLATTVNQGLIRATLSIYS